ncbi:hypothetical protein [Streptomyces cellulosae]|uniref:Barstar (barnase inhibitor) domain-containing protein n=1 Tax=Streptomyces cellulosae TaxID=1968 RepID=A0ABW7Y3G5_STRCE
MTENNGYASHPDYLPGFMNDPEDGDGRQVVKLRWAESRELEAMSLNRFPSTFSAALDWNSASYEDRLWWDDEEGWVRMASQLLSSYAERGMTVAIFWGNLALPTVTLPADVAIRHAREILDVGPHFWIYPIGASVLIECLLDGQITVAAIPAA